MKRIKSLLLTVLVIVSIYAQYSFFSVKAYELDTVVSLQIDNPIMKVNGKDMEIDKGHGTKPIVKNDRTLVPIRAIIEAFGGTVDWDGKNRTVTLMLDDDVIKLVIDSTTAYTNSRAATLDTAPVVINDRTMLPIRYIAEGFNLGVAWEGDSHRVSVIRNGFDDVEYQVVTSMVPAYSGKAAVPINGNIPFFKDYEIIGGSFEFYANLDELGRCDVAMASVGKDIMPTEKRESISSVKPSGWINVPYSFVDGGYLYNRCHLIGFQLTGENANERNLITGTRYLNVEGMLPYENMIDRYVESTNNNVMYRSTPIFSGDNLVADGVLLEARSVEDNGEGINFCIYCYNVQPNIVIDYLTGASRLANEVSNNNSNAVSRVFRTPSGKRYHYDINCGGKNSYSVTIEEALGAGLTPCSKCVK